MLNYSNRNSFGSQVLRIKTLMTKKALIEVIVYKHYLQEYIRAIFLIGNLKDLNYPCNQKMNPSPNKRPQKKTLLQNKNMLHVQLQERNTQAHWCSS